MALDQRVVGVEGVGCELGLVVEVAFAPQEPEDQVANPGDGTLDWLDV